MRWLAFMPLRGGSKSIPDKNIKYIAGKPLFAWALGEAIKSGCFDDVYVASESRAIRQAVKEVFGGEVRLFDRTAESAADTAGTEAVMLEFQSKVDFDVICLIQATSPFTRAHHFREAKEYFEDKAFDALVTVAPMRRFFWQENGTPLNYNPKQRPRRQDFAGTLTENGAFYFTRGGILQRYRSRLAGNIGVYPMAEHTLIEIDEPAHWYAAEWMLLEEIRAKYFEEINSIQALVLDVDGTLTDGGMFYADEGELMKKFDTRDANGMKLLEETGVKIAVITAEDSDVVTSRMTKLKIEEYHKGIKNKLPVLEKIAKKWQLPLTDIAYIGDDLGDMPCLQNAGFAICPNDAVPDIKRVCHYITSAKAGAGAVREACDLIRKLNSIKK